MRALHREYMSINTGKWPDTSVFIIPATIS